MGKRKGRKKRKDKLRIGDFETTIILNPESFEDYLTKVCLIPFNVAFRVTKIVKGKNKLK